MYQGKAISTRMLSWYRLLYLPCFRAGEAGEIMDHHYLTIGQFIEDMMQCMVRGWYSGHDWLHQPRIGRDQPTQASGSFSKVLRRVSFRTLMYDACQWLDIVDLGGTAPSGLWVGSKQ